jgi:ElaB/YqjD/DUF883 family membrane-anchored ribosome-binding protein
MKSYWVKIVLGAIGIFAIGMVIVTAIRKATNQVRVYSETSDPISIPFPFGIVPFRLDGDRLGTVEHLTLLRDSPDRISNIRLVIKLADSVESSRLANCFLVVTDVEHLDNNTTFKCQGADTAGLELVHYGEVELEGSGATFPLLLPASAVADLQSESGSDEMEARIDSISNAAEAMADSLSELADSITDANMEMADSIREAAQEKADSIREAAHRMADSIRQRRMTAPPPTPAVERRP